MSNVTLSSKVHLRIAEYQSTMIFIMLSRPFLHHVIQNGYVLPKSYKCEFVVPDVSDVSSEVHNGSWTGLVGMLQRNEADFATFPMTIDENKLEVVDFLNVRFLNVLTIACKFKTVFKEADILDDLIKAEWKFWLLLCICVVLVILVVILITFNIKSRNWADIAYLYLSYILCEGPVAPLPMVRTRIVATSFFWFLIILKTTLSAYLKTTLVTVEREVINSLKELNEHQTRPLILTRGGDIMHALQNPMVQEYVDLMENVRKDKNGILETNAGPETMKLKFERFISEDYAIVAERTNLYAMGDSVLCPLYPDIRINVAAEEIKGTTYGLASRKTTGKEKTSLNKMILLLTETGFVEFVQSQLRGYPSCFGEHMGTDTGKAEPFKIEGLKKTFLFLIFGISVSLITFFLELIVGKLQT